MANQNVVDDVLAKLALIEGIIAKFETDRFDKLVADRAKNIIKLTQLYIDNNQSAIPPYCLKKITDAILKLDSQIQDMEKKNFQFKFKPTVPKETHQAPSTKPSQPGSSQNFTPPILGFQDKISQQLKLGPKEIESKDVTLINLTKCKVKLEGLANTVYIRDLQDTKVTVRLACNAITITNCKNCHFKLVCQQLRIDSTLDTTFETFISARTMLESSKNLQFKCLKPDTSLLKKANFDKTKNNWKCIDDFDWLSPDTPSQNYKII